MSIFQNSNLESLKVYSEDDTQTNLDSSISNCKLKRLNYNGKNLSEDSSCKELAESIKLNESINTLIIRSLKVEDIYYIFRSLIYHKNLINLSIDNVKFEARFDVPNTIKNLLETTKTLEKLTINELKFFNASSYFGSSK